MTEQQEAGITLKQVNFIKTLVKRKAGREEPNYDEMSMTDAKKLISEWLEGTEQHSNSGAVETEQIRDVQGGEILDLLRQILAELRNWRPVHHVE